MIVHIISLSSACGNIALGALKLPVREWEGDVIPTVEYASEVIRELPLRDYPDGFLIFQISLVTQQLHMLKNLAKASHAVPQNSDAMSTWAAAVRNACENLHLMCKTAEIHCTELLDEVLSPSDKAKWTSRQQRNNSRTAELVKAKRD